MLTHDKSMVAPCGMTCTYCYVHHKLKKPCLGCRQSDSNKPNSCRHCKIKACVEEKRLQFCYECKEYPCPLIKRLDKSYRTRYQESLIQNMKEIEEIGIESFLEKEKVRLKCRFCDGHINVHDKHCYKCGQK